MRIVSTFLLAALIVASATVDLSGADWPQWRGPARTGHSAETGLLKKWPKDGPELAWTFDKAGTGYSSVAVAGGTVYLLGGRGDDEYAIALDEAGKEKWATKIGPVFDFDGNSWSRGPNAAPLIDGATGYFVSSKGVVLAANLADGKELWKVDQPKELKAVVRNPGGGPENFGWGFCTSPLLDGDKLILTPGGPDGLFAALDKKTGKVLWRSKGTKDGSTYSSPVLATIDGVKQYITIVQDGAVAVSAEDGAELWRLKKSEDYADVVPCTPVVAGNKVLIAVGYNGGGELLEVSGKGPKQMAKSVWAEREIGARQGGVVLVGETVYGYHEERNWVAQDWATGKVKWESKGRAKGAVKDGGLVAADGLLFTVDSTGVVAAFEANPDAYKEVGKFKLPRASKLRKSNGKVWTHPVLSGGLLFVRDQELLFAYKVK